jgi:hypothetical protein
MPFHSLRLGDATFSGRPSHSRPTAPYPDPPEPAPARQADLVYLSD